MKKLFVVSGLALACGVANAADFYVGTTSALTNALATATSNDTVFVSNGTYTCTTPMEAYSFLSIGTGVTLRSISGVPADVVLNGNYSTVANRVVLMTTNNSWLVGCTVSNGNMSGLSEAGNEGAGVRNGSVSNCIITDNNTSETHDPGGGGGGYNCVFYNSLIIRNRTPYADGAGGWNCEFYNCTLTLNVAGENIGNNSSPVYQSTIINSISWGNNYRDGDTTIDSYSCGIGYSGTGSITNDPLFIGEGNYRLQAGSPCINTGTNGAWTVGAKDLDSKNRIRPIGGTVDMGAYEHQIIFQLRIGGTSIFAPGGTGLGNVKGKIE